MSKSSGLNMRLFIDGYDVSGDTQALGRVGGGPAVIETTGIDKSAFERIGGRRDGAFDVSTYFNPEKATDVPGTTADRAHVAYSPLPLTDRAVTLAHIDSGEVWNAIAKQGHYDPTIAADGSITIGVGLQPNGYGLECGKLLTPTGKLTQGSAGNVASVDFGAGVLTFGAQFYLHVFAFTGTSATVKIQQSSDNGGADAFADVVGGTFVAATARGAQRIQTARNQTIERYLRVTTTGTFTDLVFAVTAEVNLTSTVF